MIDELYTQCRLVKENTEETSWIPREFAKLGQRLKIKNNDVWETGWVVKNIYGTISKYLLIQHESLQRRYREAVDI